MTAAAVWLDEWAAELIDVQWRARRARRRLSHREWGTEEYLVSGSDTSSLARRVKL
jgi:hypothetical protein